MKSFHHVALLAGALISSASTFTSAIASPYEQTNLVSSVAGLAQLTDPSLKNPWGFSFSAASPFWTSDQGTGVSTLYAVNSAGVVTKNARTVTVPTTASGPQGPTGQVFNNTTGFRVGTAASSFIFANLNGTISAWNPTVAVNNVAQIVATTPGAVYTGLAISNGVQGPRLYAANGAQNRVDVFDGNFDLVSTTSFTNTDPRLAGLVPFNVQTIGDNVYVTYAAPGRTAQLSAAEGSGAVAVFGLDGTLQQTLITGSHLASPWGITIAPTAFGGFGGDLLVGNFSYAVAEINAFDPITGAYLGTVADRSGTDLVNAGLWAIAFGNGVSGNADTLYFNAGINDERDGLFGAITAVPEPETLALFTAGLVAVMVGRRRRATA